MPTDESTIVFYLLVIGALAYVACARSIADRIDASRAAARQQQGRCPGCGYIIAPGVSSVCSECGADVSSVRRGDGDPGVALPGRPPRRPILSTLLLTVVMFPLTLLAAYPLACLDRAHWYATLRTVSRFPTGDFVLTAWGSGRDDAFEAAQIQVGIARPVVPHFDVEYRWTKSAFLRSLRSGDSIRPWTRPDLKMHLVSLGFSEDASTEHLAKTLYDQCERLRKNQEPGVTTEYEMEGSRVITRDEMGGPFMWLPWYTAWCLIPWLLLTALLSLPLWWWHDRRRMKWRLSHAGR